MRLNNSDNEIVKVTDHFGYRKEIVVKEILFVVYNLDRTHERGVSAFKKESRARQECRYLERLNMDK